MDCFDILSEQSNHQTEPCDSNVWFISAPIMGKASIFLHVASGILKIGSQEAEKFEKL